MPRVGSASGGFTLVEMMTAVAILVLLLGIIFGIMSETVRLADSTTRGGDASDEGRQVLDEIGQDIAGMVIRPDVDQQYPNAASGSNTSGSDEMFFYSQVPGYFDASVPADQYSNISLVGYRIDTSAQPGLQRIAQGTTWNGAGVMSFLVFPLQAPLTLPVDRSKPPVASSGLVDPTAVTASFWHTVGSQVFRLSIYFQLRDGSLTLTPPTPSAPTAPSTVTKTPVPAVPGGLTDTTGIVVAIAVLDSKSRKIVPAGSWPKMIAALREPTASDLSATPPNSPVLIDSIWNATLNSPTFPQSVGIPVTATSHIHVYQRFYSLNPVKIQ